MGRIRRRYSTSGLKKDTIIIPTMLGTTSSDENADDQDGITSTRTQWYQEHSNHFCAIWWGYLSVHQGVWWLLGRIRSHLHAIHHPRLFKLIRQLRKCQCWILRGWLWICPSEARKVPTDLSFRYTAESVIAVKEGWKSHFARPVPTSAV